MKIRHRRVSADQPPLVVAELGVNHDGSVERGVELVRAAARAGADAIKLQFFRAELLLSRAALLAGYQAGAGERDPVAMLRRVELDARALARIARAAHEQGLAAVLTVFSTPLVDQAERVGDGVWDAYKVASPDVINRPLLEALAATGRPLLVSTGAATLEEVGRAVGWLSAVRQRVCLLQCVSAYPTPKDQAALDGIGALQAAFGLPVGYSDHTVEEETGAAAVRHGAVLLEKHVTLDRSAPGPDHAVSLEPAGLARYVSLARAAWAGRGASWAADGGASGGAKRVLAIERDVRRVARQSVTTRRVLERGEVVGAEDVCLKRPGTGLEPWRLAEVIGRRVVRRVEADVPLCASDLEPAPGDVGRAVVSAGAGGPGDEGPGRASVWE